MSADFKALAGDDRANYLHSILDPLTTRTHGIPDNSTQRVVIKPSLTDTTVTMDRDYGFLYIPFSAGAARMLRFVRVLNPSDPTSSICGWVTGGEVVADSDLYPNYNKVRLVCGAQVFRAATLSATQVSLNGKGSGTQFTMSWDPNTFDPAKVLAYNPNDALIAQLASDGWVARAIPSGRDVEFQCPATALSNTVGVVPYTPHFSVPLESRYDASSSYWFHGSVAQLAEQPIFDSLGVAAPQPSMVNQWMRGKTKISGMLSMQYITNGTTLLSQQVHLNVTYVNDLGVEVIQAQFRVDLVRDNIPGVWNFTYVFPFEFAAYLKYPIYRVSLVLSDFSTGAPFTSVQVNNGSVIVNCVEADMQNNEFPQVLVATQGFAGASDPMELIIAGNEQWEALPSFQLSQEVTGTIAVKAHPHDLTIARNFIARNVMAKSLLTLRQFEAQQLVLPDIMDRHTLAAYALSWGDIVRFGRSFLDGASRVLDVGVAALKPISQMVPAAVPIYNTLSNVQSFRDKAKRLLGAQSLTIAVVDLKELREAGGESMAFAIKGKNAVVPAGVALKLKLRVVCQGYYPAQGYGGKKPAPPQKETDAKSGGAKLSDTDTATAKKAWCASVNFRKLQPQRLPRFSVDEKTDITHWFENQFLFDKPQQPQQVPSEIQDTLYPSYPADYPTPDAYFEARRRYHAAKGMKPGDAFQDLVTLGLGGKKALAKLKALKITPSQLLTGMERAIGKKPKAPAKANWSALLHETAAAPPERYHKLTQGKDAAFMIQQAADRDINSKINVIDAPAPEVATKSQLMVAAMNHPAHAMSRPAFAMSAGMTAAEAALANMIDPDQKTAPAADPDDDDDDTDVPLDPASGPSGEVEPPDEKDVLEAPAAVPAVHSALAGLLGDVKSPEAVQTQETYLSFVTEFKNSLAGQPRYLKAWTDSGNAGAASRFCLAGVYIPATIQGKWQPQCAVISASESPFMHTDPQGIQEEFAYRTYSFKNGKRVAVHPPVMDAAALSALESVSVIMPANIRYLTMRSVDMTGFTSWNGASASLALAALFVGIPLAKTGLTGDAYTHEGNLMFKPSVGLAGKVNAVKLAIPNAGFLALVDEKERTGWKDCQSVMGVTNLSLVSKLAVRGLGDVVAYGLSLFRNSKLATVGVTDAQASAVIAAKGTPEMKKTYEVAKATGNRQALENALNYAKGLLVGKTPPPPVKNGIPYQQLIAEMKAMGLEKDFKVADVMKRSFAQGTYKDATLSEATALRDFLDSTSTAHFLAKDPNFLVPARLVNMMKNNWRQREVALLAPKKSSKKKKAGGSLKALASQLAASNSNEDFAFSD